METSEMRLKCKNTENQVSCSVPRKLSEEELNKLSVDHICLSEFKQQNLEAEAQKNWDLFYKRNTTKFFKDRHWTKREFEDLPNHVKIKLNLIN